MKKGKFAKRGHRGAANKTLALILSMVLIIGCVAGGTLAWLTANTDAVVNKFDNSTIGVELNETTTTYKMVPGWAIDKDPWAKVSATSEDCYLFVKVTKSANFDTYMLYAIDDQWTQLEDADGNDVEGVYYMVFDSKDNTNTNEKGTAYNILGEGTYSYTEDGVTVNYSWTDNQVLTKPEVTKTMMETAASSKPTLTFEAHAVQLYKSNNETFAPYEAWALK